MKKYFICLLLTVFLINSVTGQLKEVSIENEFIKVSGNIEFGSMILRTTGGDPDLGSDQDVDLTSEDIEPTTLTTIRIDEADYKFGYKIDEDNGYFEQKMNKRGDMITVTWNAKYISISQTLKLVKGPTTKRMDTLEVRYDVLNNDLRAHDIGIRIMFDTHLSPDSFEGGKKDGYVFFQLPQPNNIKIMKEYELVAEQIPDYWFCFNDVVNPTIALMGSLKFADSPMPDKILFAEWGRFKREYFDFVIKPEKEFRRFSGVQDSAIGLIWNPRTVQPSEGFSIKTLIGLYKEPSYEGGTFDVTLSGPDKTAGEPVKLSANIKNISPFIIETTKAELLPAEGMKLATNETVVKDMANLERNNVKRVSWNILPNLAQPGMITAKVKVTGIVNGNPVEVIVEKQIEYVQQEVPEVPDVVETVPTLKEVPVTTETKEGYTFYDFSHLNRIISDLNIFKNTNNKKVGEINGLIDEIIIDKKDVDYTKSRGIKDRKIIDGRKGQTQDLEGEIPEAVKSAIIQKEKIIEEESSTSSPTNTGQ